MFHLASFPASSIQNAQFPHSVCVANASILNRNLFLLWSWPSAHQSVGLISKLIQFIITSEPKAQFVLGNLCFGIIGY